MVLKQVLEPQLELIFDQDSYGDTPGLTTWVPAVRADLARRRSGSGDSRPQPERSPPL